MALSTKAASSAGQSKRREWWHPSKHTDCGVFAFLTRSSGFRLTHHGFNLLAFVYAQVPGGQSAAEAQPSLHAVAGSPSSLDGECPFSYSGFMTDEDLQYVRDLVERRMVFSPVLELGAGYGGKTAKSIIEDAGLEYKSTDIEGDSTVDLVADFEDDDILRFFGNDEPFGSVLVCNVLEHVFDPVRALSNALRLVRLSGSLVAVTPCMWPIHDFPSDYQRLLPSWYDEFARRTCCMLDRELFVFIGRGRVDSFRDPQGDYALPRPGRNSFHSIYSRIVHKALNTHGRGMWAAGWLAIGATFVKTSEPRDGSRHGASRAP